MTRSKVKVKVTDDGKLRRWPISKSIIFRQYGCNVELWYFKTISKFWLDGFFAIRRHVTFKLRVLHLWQTNFFLLRWVNRQCRVGRIVVVIMTQTDRQTVRETWHSELTCMIDVVCVSRSAMMITSQTDMQCVLSTLLSFFVTYAQILRYNNYNKLSYNKSSKSQWILLWHLLLCVITSLYCSLKSTEFNAVCCRGKHLDCSGRFASEDWNYLTVKFTTRGQIIVAQRHDERGKTQQTSAAILKVFRSPCFSAKSTTSDEIWSTWQKILKFKMADNAFWGVGLLFFGHNWSREYCSLSAMTQNQTLKMITGQNYCQISQFNVACWGRGYFTVMSTEFDDVCRAWLNLIVMFLRLKLTILTI